jgi:hypothetical protein
MAYPRHWVTERCGAAADESRYSVDGEMTWVEEVHLPSWADLGDINIAPKIALQADGERTPVEVVARPNEVARAFWRDPTGCRWRIPMIGKGAESACPVQRYWLLSRYRKRWPRRLAGQQ